MIIPEIIRVKESRVSDAPAWGRALKGVRNEIHTAMEYGRTVGSLFSLIALAGLLYWCPRCGQWMGPGSEGQGPGVPNPEAPPVPRRLLRAIGVPLSDEPTSSRDLPQRHQGELTPNSGILESPGTQGQGEAKLRHHPLSDAHGRKIDNLYGGHPKPDSRPHGHNATFIRGDSEQIPLYDRSQDGTIVYESGTDVVFQKENGVYEWMPNGRQIIPGPEPGN